MRVIVSALAICAASFLIGVAGDLSSATPLSPTPSRPVAIVQLPPVTAPPVDLTHAVRAHPLTSAAAPHVVREAIAHELSRPAPLESLQALTLEGAESDVLAGGPSESPNLADLPPGAQKHPLKPNRVAAWKQGVESPQKA